MSPSSLSIRSQQVIRDPPLTLTLTLTLTLICGIGVARVAMEEGVRSFLLVCAVPVDVHVWRIACRDYDHSLAECKSLTPAV